MTAPAYCYAASAWLPLPGPDYGRALRPDAEPVLHYGFVPSRRSRKATQSAATVTFNAADQSARDRAAGVVRLSRDDRKTLREAARVQQYQAAVESAAALRTHGKLVLASTEPFAGKWGWTFRARCSCGTTITVLCSEWIARSHRLPRMCRACGIASAKLRNGCRRSKVA